MKKIHINIRLLILLFFTLIVINMGILSINVNSQQSNEIFDRLYVKGDWFSLRPIGLEDEDGVMHYIDGDIIDMPGYIPDLFITHSRAWINNVTSLGAIPRGNKTYFGYLYNLSFTVTICTRVFPENTLYYKYLEPVHNTVTVLDKWWGPGIQIDHEPHTLTFHYYKYKEDLPTNESYNPSVYGDLIFEYTLAPEYDLNPGAEIVKTENGRYIYRGTWAGIIGIDVGKRVSNGTLTKESVRANIPADSKVNNIYYGQNKTLSNPDEYSSVNEYDVYGSGRTIDIDSNRDGTVDGYGYTSSGGDTFWGGYLGHSEIQFIRSREIGIFAGAGSSLSLFVENTNVTDEVKYVENGTYDLDILGFGHDLQKVRSSEYLQFRPRLIMYWVTHHYRTERFWIGITGGVDWFAKTTSGPDYKDFKAGVTYVVYNYYVIREYYAYVLYITETEWHPSLLAEGRPQDPPDAYTSDIIVDILPEGELYAGYTPWWGEPENIIILIIIIIIIIVIVIVVLYIVYKIYIGRFKRFIPAPPQAPTTVQAPTVPPVPEKPKDIKRIIAKTVILLAILLGISFIILSLIGMMGYYSYVVVASLLIAGIYAFIKL